VGFGTDTGMSMVNFLRFFIFAGLIGFPLPFASEEATVTAGLVIDLDAK
jgi:hypothetical protein